VKFVFYIALPCLVINGLGINIDIYDDAFLWTFISAFLILRGIALVFALLLVACSNKNSIGQVAVLWLAFTWISTIILGVPISSAVFNDPRIGQTYGLLAGISSFIFQLPVQLLLLECHTLENDHNSVPSGQLSADDGEQKRECTAEMDACESGVCNPVENEIALPQESAPNDQENRSENEDPSYSRWLRFAIRRDVWVKILGKVIENPVLWGIAIGFFLTLSKIGPKYLLLAGPWAWLAPPNTSLAW